ncbi:GntR family transcriptional regulator [Verticiella sediminum]|uniref:GntR family transcriptional regulator n=1 Tax=Verticiella sediminum TaxID=1247510 RepID=A0A556AKK2_9BURK|nr:GntR family transcriptional regulator [Verticiella sediminum]TSH93403.1 GntR family transcriptional regulator [Verticiella sediminum]
MTTYEGGLASASVPQTPASEDQERTNRPQTVYDALFQDIVTGRLRAGERLFIDEIAERFGVSKIPVREAMKALEGRGWVESAPRRGTYVRKLSMEELHELFELRQILEPSITALAAHRRRTQHLQQLAALIEEGEAAIAADDFVTSSRVNSEFHSVIAQAADNTLAYAVIQDLELRLCRYFFVASWEERKESMRQHEALYKAIRDQDVDAARRLTVEHLRHTEAMAARSISVRDMA